MCAGGLSCELWATAAALLGAPCVGAGVGDDELNLMLSMPSRPEWDGTVGAVERRVRRQAAPVGVPGGNATSEAMAAAAVTMARQVGEGRSTCLWLPAPLSHLRHCGNPPDQLDEIRARVAPSGRC